MGSMLEEAKEGKLRETPEGDHTAFKFHMNGSRSAYDARR